MKSVGIVSQIPAGLQKFQEMDRDLGFTGASGADLPVKGPETKSIFTFCRLR